MTREFLPLCKPMIGEEEVTAAAETLRSGWITTGKAVAEFEEAVKRYTGASHAIGLTSCTGGLHIALAALDIGPGDEVIVPTYTFAACAHVVAWLGAKPVLVDVERATFNIDPEAIEAAITPKTRAIMPVHFAGHACDLDRIHAIAKQHKLRVVEDAAHAIGTTYKGQQIATHSDAAIYSFYATKTITTAEGGMLVTDDEQLAKRCRRLSYFGVDKDAYNRYTEKGTWYYEIIELGHKYNMDNIHGAIGCEQMRKLDAFIEKRRALATTYHELLSTIDGVQVPREQDYTRHTYHLYPLLLPRGCERQSVVEALREARIGTSVHYIPLHLHPYYQKTYGYAKGDFPVAEELYERELSLPLYPGMDEEDVRYVVGKLKECLRS